MPEETPGKSEADPPTGSSEPSATVQKTPEKREEASAEPSPPRLAPEVPTTTTKTPEKKEENGGIKEEEKPTKSSPMEEPPTLVRSSPQQQPQQQQQPSQSQQPSTVTPQAPPPSKPRGRPPGVPNKNNAAAMNQIAMQNLKQQQQQQQIAHQTAQMMHRNGHALAQTMQMPQMMHVNTDGQQQYVQMFPGQSTQFLQQMFQGNMQGRPRFPVTQMRQPIPQQQQQQQQQQHQQQQQQQQQQQGPPGGPNQTVPVLIPVPPGQSNNPIQVPMSAIVRLPDGSFQIRPELVQKPTGAIIQQQYIDANGQPAVRQLKLTPNQTAMMHQAMMHKALPQQLIIQQHQQQRPQPNDMQQLQQQQQQQQQQQLTRQNLDRLATTSAGSNGSRTSDWVGAHQPSASNGVPPRAPSPLQSMIQLQPAGQPSADVTEMEEDDGEAAPQLAAEAGDVLNVESLNAEEAFQQESNGGYGRKKNAGKQAKVIIHDIDGHKIIETTEPSNSTHLDNDDFEPIHEEDDEDDDRSYEGKEDEAPSRKLANGVAPGLTEWMQNRLEMDIPREERKTKKEPPQPHKPHTRADGVDKKKRKRKSNELKSLIQMDFGPAENSRRAKNMLPTLINTVATLKETPKSLRNVERRSNSAAGGSIAGTSKGKETRNLRNRDSSEKTKECRACGKTIDEKKADKQHPGYCSDTCYSMSRSQSPANTEDEDDDTTSIRTDETPEPMSRKKESSTTPTSKKQPPPIKEEPIEEPTGRGKRVRIPKKEHEEIVTPKKETPKKEEKKKIVKEVKKEVKEEVEEEKQKSPPSKKKTVVEKKTEEPPPKKSKVDAPSPLPPPPQAVQTPLLVAALTAPSSYSQQPVQQQRQPAVMPVAPLDAVIATVPLPPPVPPVPIVAAPTPIVAPPSVPEMDPITCKQLSVEQVRAWVERITGKPEVAQQFADEDVDGSTLLELKYDDLRGDLKLSLGMAKKVYAAIEEISKRRPVGSDD